MAETPLKFMLGDKIYNVSRDCYEVDLIAPDGQTVGALFYHDEETRARMHDLLRRLNNGK